jgi:hypothetical protein
MKGIARLMILALIVLGVACGGTAAVTTSIGGTPTTVEGIQTGPSHVLQYLEY